MDYLVEHLECDIWLKKLKVGLFFSDSELFS